MNWKHLFFQQQQNLACFQNKLLCRFPKKILYGISHQHYAEGEQLYITSLCMSGMGDEILQVVGMRKGPDSWHALNIKDN